MVNLCAIHNVLPFDAKKYWVLKELYWVTAKTDSKTRLLSKLCLYLRLLRCLTDSATHLRPVNAVPRQSNASNSNKILVSKAVYRVGVNFAEIYYTHNECEGRDSNSHRLPHWNLNPARLPFRHLRNKPPEL